MSGEAAPGLRLADPRESHMKEGAWNTNHTRGGGSGSGYKEKSTGAHEFTAGQAVLAKFKSLPGKYPGTINVDNGDGTYVVVYEDGDIDNKVKAKNIIDDSDE